LALIDSQSAFGISEKVIHNSPYLQKSHSQFWFLWIKFFFTRRGISFYYMNLNLNWFWF